MNASSNKCVVFEIMTLLIGKKLPKSNKKLKKKVYIQLIKRPSKLDEKIKKKTKRSLLMKNLLNLMRKQRRKPIIDCFVRDKKPLIPSYKNKKENQILIKNKDKRFLDALD